MNKICVITSTHNAFDTRIFHKECYSLVKAGFAVELIAPVDEPITMVNGICVRGFGRLKSRGARIINLWKIAFLVLKDKAAFYHVHEPELLLLLPLIRLMRPRAFFIYDVHENYADAVLSGEKHWIPSFLKPIVAGLFDIIEKGLGRFANLIVAASPDIEKNFTRHKTISVRNFAPMHLIDAVLEKPGNSPKQDVEFVYTGSLTPTRGIMEIVQAMDSIPATTPVYLKVTGWFHDESFRKKIESQKGFSRIRFLGRLKEFEDMLKAICGARGAFMCFHADPNLDNAAERSNKLFEYMGLGIPLIISDVPGWAEIVEKYRCGVVVTALDPADIAAKMVYLASNPEIAQTMGENGRNAVLKFYSWETEGATLVNSYQKLMGI
jgi:glycosyltransferase involved in cell wall biosynthesis